MNDKKSRILEQERLQGEAMNKSEVIGKIISIVDYKLMDSKYGGSYGIIQACFPGESNYFTIVINSFMLKQLMQVLREKYPLKVKVIKNEHYVRFERVEE